MRIAVSGTHCTGKSTLIDEFLRVYPDFVHEPEPYTVLVDELGEEFSAEPRVDDFLRQLEFNIGRLKEHGREERVIYERCPIDFLAYVECLSQTHPLPRGGTDPIPLDVILPAVSECLDVIIYLPIDKTIDVDDDFPKLRRAVDRRLSEIYHEDDLGIISAAGLTIIEATGPVENRLRTIEAALQL